MGPSVPHTPMDEGLDQDAEYVGDNGMILRSEYVRLIEQALHCLGYPSVAEQLEKESGIVMQPTVATEFRSAVLEGRWDEALSLLPQLGSQPGSGDASAPRFLLLRRKYLEAVASGDSAGALHCLRHCLQPLDLSARTLHGLASQLLAPLASKQSEGGPEGGREGMAVDEGEEEARGGEEARALEACSTPLPPREEVLREIQFLLPPSLLIPDRRLEALLEQALAAQLAACPFHNARAPRLSLFMDYRAGLEQLPTQLAQRLEDAHGDEVWSVQFSPCGRLLATASKDGTAALWTVGPGGRVTFKRRLVESAVHMNTVAFSPDGRALLTAGADSRVRLHRLPGGEPVAQLVLGDGPEAAAVNAVAWFPDCRRFVAAALDRTLHVVDLGEALGESWAQGGAEAEGEAEEEVAALAAPRPPVPLLSAARLQAATTRLKQLQHVYDVAVSPDGGTLVIVGQDKRLRYLRLADERQVSVAETGAVTCLSAAADGSLLLANLSNHTIHLWPLGDLSLAEGGADARHCGLVRPLTSRFPSAARGAAPASASGREDPLDALPPAPLQEYRFGDGSAGRFVIRSALGGAENNFVASGSDAGAVFIWHRESGTLLHQLQGHRGTVNAVAWSPTNPYLLVSVSDDASMCVWIAKAAAGHWDRPLIQPGRLQKVRLLSKDAYQTVTLCLLHETVADGRGKWRDPPGIRPRRVAVKRLRVTALTDHVVTCFAREAEMMVSLQHSCLVDFVGVGCDARTEAMSWPSMFLVYEYAAGGTLESLLAAQMRQRRRLYTLEQALDWAHDISQALHYLHDEAGIMHRSVSASAVFLVKDPGLRRLRARLGHLGLCCKLGTAPPAGADLAAAMSRSSFSLARASMTSQNPSSAGVSRLQPQDMVQRAQHADGEATPDSAAAFAARERLDDAPAELGERAASLPTPASAPLPLFMADKAVSLKAPSPPPLAARLGEDSAEAVVMARWAECQQEDAFCYMAPQVLRGEPYDAPADVFALGVVLYELFMRRSVYALLQTQSFGPLDPAAYAEQVSDGYRMPLRDKLPKRLKSVIRACMEGDPRHRPSALSVVGELQKLQDQGGINVTDSFFRCCSVM